MFARECRTNTADAHMNKAHNTAQIDAVMVVISYACVAVQGEYERMTHKHLVESVFDRFRII